MDFDGDELNLLDEPAIIAAAERTIKDYNIVPLFYDAKKAPKKRFEPEERYQALLRAHEFGRKAIGDISNTLTKLWNNNFPNDPDEKMDQKYITMAARVCCRNNYIIDGAKTGDAPDYPEDKKPEISEVMHDKKPWFFQFSINGRKAMFEQKTKISNKKKRVEATGEVFKKKEKKSKWKDEPNNSPMNKIAQRFSKLDRMPRIEYPDLGDFNPYMLLSKMPPERINPDIFNEFDHMLNLAHAEDHEMKQHKMRQYEDAGQIDKYWWDERRQEIKEELLKKFKDEDEIYAALVITMFEGAAMSESRKEQFWAMYGDKAYKNICYNIEHCHKCEKPDCHMDIPDWQTDHEEHHQKEDDMHIRCRDCEIIFEYYGKQSNHKIYCPACTQKQKERNRKSNQLTQRLKKAEDKFSRMDHITEYECQETETFLPLFQWYYTFKRK